MTSTELLGYRMLPGATVRIFNGDASSMRRYNSAGVGECFLVGYQRLQQQSCL